MTLNMHPNDFGNMKSFEQTLTLPELDAYIADLRMKGADNISIYLIEKLVRYMSPFTAIILTFIGVVLSRKTRGRVGFQIALGFFIAFLYILLFIAAKVMQKPVVQTQFWPSGLQISYLSFSVILISICA